MLACRRLEGGEYGEAEAAFRRVLKGGDEDFRALALLGMGVVRYERGDLGQAIEHLRLAGEAADPRLLPLIDQYRAEAERRDPGVLARG
jgi:tetratricopeptide (TPR) repeat protein